MFVSFKREKNSFLYNTETRECRLLTDALRRYMSKHNVEINSETNLPEVDSFKAMLMLSGFKEKILKEINFHGVGLVFSLIYKDNSLHIKLFPKYTSLQFTRARVELNQMYRISWILRHDSIHKRDYYTMEVPFALAYSLSKGYDVLKDIFEHAYFVIYDNYIIDNLSMTGSGYSYLGSVNIGNRERIGVWFNKELNLHKLGVISASAYYEPEKLGKFGKPVCLGNLDDRSKSGVLHITKDSIVLKYNGDVAKVQYPDNAICIRGRLNKIKDYDFEYKIVITEGIAYLLLNNEYFYCDFMSYVRHICRFYA